jgi:acyl-CoA thioesterase-1
MSSRRGSFVAMRSVLFVTLVAACESATAESPQSLPQSRQTVTQTAAPAPAAQGPRVVFLGDSISAGLHLPADQAFPAVVQQKLATRGVHFQLMNAGLSGDTSAGGLRRIDWLLKQSPALVVIELGGNDGLRGVPLPSIEANLRALIAKVKAQGARVLLLGMRIPPSYGADYAQGFADLYPRLAAELAVPLVPTFMDGVGGVPELNLEDGLHPTAQGHEKLAETLAPKLAEQLATLR